MAVINRQTIIFFLPMSMDAITGGQSQHSSSSDGTVSWDKRQMFINPQTLAFREKKFVKPDLTKGGFVVQYWGEDLTTIEVNGTTGSSGIEGINVLRGIYRHEQFQFRRVLANRQREMAMAAQSAAKDAEAKLSERTDDAGVFSQVVDAFTGGAASKAATGLENAIDQIFDTGKGTTFGSSGTFSSAPTLAAFATNIDMYYQGEFYRGFFSNFTTTESAAQPGLFDYQFSFTVTRRSGKRENFMPWHREPVSYDGETVMSQKTTESKGEAPGSDNLTFPKNEPRRRPPPKLYTPGQPGMDHLPEGPGYTTSEFNDSPQMQAEPNGVPVNRNESIG